MTPDPEPMDVARFFEYGEVSFTDRDFPSRQASIHICIPCCLFQAVTPALLGAGIIDEFYIRDPLAVWMPKLAPERVRGVDSGMVNTTIHHHAETSLEIFRLLSHHVNNVADLVPLLPLGIYIALRFRCRIDDIPKVLFAIQGIPVDGVHEFQWALASVLACVLQDFQMWESFMPQLPSRL
jgi:hypothetical protein